MNILAINFNHDGSGAIVADGDIVGYANTERFSRLKKHPGLRKTELDDILSQAKMAISDIDFVQLVNLNNMDSSDIPMLHGTGLKETWPEFWIDNSFRNIKLMNEVLPCELTREHHIFHAMLAYAFSPFDSCVSLAIDPLGAHVYFVRDGKLLRENSRRRFVSSQVYSLAAEELFGTAIIGAGKLMGLAPFGATGNCPLDYEVLRRKSVADAYLEIAKASTAGSNVILKGDKPLNATLAFHAQALLETELSALLLELSKDAKRLGVDPNLCLSGGTALNSVANQRCFEKSPFERLYMHPACGDDGTSLGAALFYWHIIMRQPKRCRSNREAMYSCRTYEDKIPWTVSKYGDQLQVKETANYIQEAAALIADGKVIGWFQGPSEIGPRALGNRSILADPRSCDMKNYLNSVIKQREGFRPFAPSILEEYAQSWFGISDSPFMLRAATVRYDTVPAVTHIDGSSRFQTVALEDNASYYKLINCFYQLTGVPMVLNTSFNGKGEPIVETPEDAIRSALKNGLDALIFPRLIIKLK